MPLFGQQSCIGFIGAGAVGGTLAVALEQAGYRVVAVATDAAGNVSAPSAATAITVDTTPPTVSRPAVNGHS